MSRNTLEKIVVASLMVICYLVMPKVGYNGDSSIASHFLYILSHANMWHLAGNLFVFVLIKGNHYLLSSVPIAIFASFIPSFGVVWPVDGVTMGFSGVLFAIAGTKYGIFCHRSKNKHQAYRAFFMRALPFSLVGIFVPHLNWCIHTYCLLAGFVYGKYKG